MVSLWNASKDCGIVLRDKHFCYCLHMRTSVGPNRNTESEELEKEKKKGERAGWFGGKGNDNVQDRLPVTVHRSR